jgi:hypothetical protein
MAIMGKTDERILALEGRAPGALRVSVASLVLCWLGWGAADAASLQSTCPGAAAWNEAHREQLPEAMAARDATRTFTDPNLRKELEERFAADQQARKEYLAAPHNPTFVNRMVELDAKNLMFLKALVRDKGIPTVDQVGENGVRWTWLLVQHASRGLQLQTTVLPMFVKRYEAGELGGDDVAKLTDRILVAQGKPQRFGTQFDWLSGQFEHHPAAEVAQIDAHRQELGLMPMSDYACMMNARSKNLASGEGSP